MVIMLQTCDLRISTSLTCAASLAACSAMIPSFTVIGSRSRHYMYINTYIKNVNTHNIYQHPSPALQTWQPAPP